MWTEKARFGRLGSVFLLALATCVSCRSSGGSSGDTIVVSSIHDPMMLGGVNCVQATEEECVFRLEYKNTGHAPLTENLSDVTLNATNGDHFSAHAPNASSIVLQPQQSGAIDYEANGVEPSADITSATLTDASGGKHTFSIHLTGLGTGS